MAVDPLQMMQMFQALSPEQKNMKIEQAADQLARQGVPPPQGGGLPQALQAMQQFQQNPQIGFMGQGPAPAQLGLGGQGPAPAPTVGQLLSPSIQNQPPSASVPITGLGLVPQTPKTGGWNEQLPSEQTQKLAAALGQLQPPKPIEPYPYFNPPVAGAATPAQGLQLPQYVAPRLRALGEYL